MADLILARRALDELRLTEVLHCIRTSTCQYCRKEGKLLPYKLKKVTSYVVRQHIKEQDEFACRGCARSRLTRSSLHSLVAGWWSLAGARATPYAIFCNLRTVVLDLSEAEVNWCLSAINTLGNWIERIAPSPSLDKRRERGSAKTAEIEIATLATE